MVNNNIELNAYIESELREYYPSSKQITLALVAEIGRNLVENGYGADGFDKVLQHFCPTWLKLRDYLILKPTACEWKGTTVLGIWIASADDYRRYSELTGLGCCSPIMLRKHNLSEPGSNYILAASILMDCAVSDDQRKVVTRYLKWANIEHKQLMEYNEKTKADCENSPFTKAYKRMCEQTGGQA